ncbi:MAG TPA: hypothetical protein VJ725_07290 [Thermoanaerobaculia bacterium]|nr:hypothetical protein [Thermoanaerobaculia bacterium]
MAVQIRKIGHAIRNECPPFSGYVDQLALTGGAAATYTVPANCDTIGIGYGGEVSLGIVVYARTDGGTAVVPAATITDGTGSEAIGNGERREVSPGQTISFIAENGDTVLTLSCFGAKARI